jgi:hypothetical protein
MNPKDFKKILELLNSQGLDFDQWRILYLKLKLKPTKKGGKK